MLNMTETSTCILTLPLLTEKWQSDRLERRFEAARQVYNSFLRFELKNYDRLKASSEYQEVTEAIKELRKLGKNDADTAKKKELQATQRKLLSAAGMSKYAFTTAIKDFYKHFNGSIGSSVAVHCIAKRVWAAFDKMLYSNGKMAHFKKKGELNSLSGYSTKKSGGVEIIFRGDHIEWKGLMLAIKLDPKNTYESAMLEKHIKYCTILRRRSKHKTRWYVQLAMAGTPAVKLDKSGSIKHPVGSGPVGIDIGTQTLAYASDHEVALLELASEVESIEREKRLLQRKLDRSRRIMNPEYYNPDGTIKRGIKLEWRKSKRYLKNQNKLAFLQSRQAATRKRQHNELANHLLSLGDRFYVEDMNWLALAKRMRETRISEKTGRFIKKRRFGKSIGNRGPATLIGMLDQKLTSLGYAKSVKVPLEVKASQYNHQIDDYVKKKLSERWNTMQNGKRIQRDLYSAFLLQHFDPVSNALNKKSIRKDYDRFVEMHDATIEKLRAAPKLLSSMGIVRTAS